jgi:hypothetical protein
MSRISGASLVNSVNVENGEGDFEWVKDGEEGYEA